MKEDLISVACLIYDNEKKKVCLIKRRDVPVWVLPGGGVDQGEDPKFAAQREAFEELNVEFEAKRLVGIYYPKNRLSKKTYLYELVTSSQIYDLPTEETLGARFFNIDDLPEMPPPYENWIQDGLNIPDGAISYSYIKGVHYGNFLKLLVMHPLKVLRFVLSRLGMHWNS